MRRALMLVTVLTSCSAPDDVHTVSLNGKPVESGRMLEGTASQVIVRAYTEETTFHDRREVTRPIVIKAGPPERLRVANGATATNFTLLAGMPGPATLDVQVEGVAVHRDILIEAQPAD